MLEVVKHPDRFPIYKRQKLHQDHGTHPALGIDPVEGIV
jgi:hypothetical protein